MILFCACQDGTEQKSEQNGSSTIAESKSVQEQKTVYTDEKENITKLTETQEVNFDDETKIALSLIGKTTEEAISILGEKYEEGLTGDGLMCYSFKDVGVNLTLESYDSAQTEIKVYTITFDKSYSVYGCKSGMLFDQIKEKLGDVETVETFIETPDHKAYTLIYIFGNAELWFVSYEKSGSDSNMFLELKL